MKPKTIIILVVMLYNISDAVPSEHNRVLRRLPEDRRRMALFPKIAKKFVITPSLEAKPAYMTSIKRSNDLNKKRVMPKIIPRYEKETVVLPVYKPPVTRRPLMKIMKFTLVPYPVQPQSNEEFIVNSINKKNFVRYDTFGSYENESKESMHVEDNKESEEDERILNENESVGDEDYDNDMTEKSEKIESQEDSHNANTLKSNVIQGQTGGHQHAEEDNYRMHSSETLSNEEVRNIIITNPSEKHESGEDTSDGEILNDTEGIENKNENEKANSENVSDEIFKVKFLEEIDDSNDDTNISNEELDFTTESQFSEEREDTLGVIGLQHDQSTFATTYLNTKTSVTKPIEKRTEEFIDLYNIETIGPVVNIIRTRFKRNKRSANIIEEENLGTTVIGFKFTGREQLLDSDLIFKNINT